MAVNSGYKTKVGLGVESTIGTAVTPTLLLPTYKADGLQIEQEVKTVDPVTGDKGSTADTYLGLRKLGFEYEVALYPNILGYILTAGVSAPTSSTVEAGAYQHVFTEGVVKTLTIVQDMPDYVKQYAGAYVDKLDFETKVGDDTKFKFNGYGLSLSDGSSVTAGMESATPLSWTHAKSVTIGTTDVSCYVNEISIEFDNQLENVYMLCGVNPQAITSKGVQIKGTMTLSLDNNSANYLTEYLNNADKSFTIEFEGDTISGTSTKYSFKMEFNRAKWSAWKTSVGEDYNKVEAEFIVVKDSTGTMATYTLVNDTASY